MIKKTLMIMIVSEEADLLYNNNMNNKNNNKTDYQTIWSNNNLYLYYDCYVMLFGLIIN